MALRSGFEPPADLWEFARVPPVETRPREIPHSYTRSRGECWLIMEVWIGICSRCGYMMRVSKMGTYRCGGCDATAVLCDNVANKNAAVGLLCETCGGQVTWQDGRTLCAECGWTHAVTMGQSRERWQELSERWRKVKQQRQKEADKERRKAATREARQHLYPNWECPKCG